MSHKATIKLAGEDFDMARGALTQCRTLVFEAWKSAADPKEKEFYSGRVDYYDALLTKFDKALQSDTSEDAADEDVDGDEEE